MKIWHYNFQQIPDTDPLQTRLSTSLPWEMRSNRRERVNSEFSQEVGYVCYMNIQALSKDSVKEIAKEVGLKINEEKTKE